MAQIEPSGPTVPSTPSGPSVSAPGAPQGPAVGGTLGGSPQPGGFIGFGGPGSAPLTPDSRTRAGTVGFPFTAVGAEPASQRAWRIVPSLGLEQIYNDNIDFSSTNQRDDFITRITPGLLLGVDTLRLQGTLNYAPSYDYYWQNDDESRLNHQGNGQFLFAAIPDFLFLDTRGSAAVQSLSGGFTPGTEASTARGDEVQTLSFSASPYIVQRFGGTATARVGYVYTYVNQDRVDPNAALPIDQLPSSFAPSEYSSHQAYAVVRTGEDFGRLAMQGTLSGTRFEGDGLYRDAYRDIGVVETRYAFTQFVAGLIEFGWERQRFNTIPQIDIDDAVWAFGVRLTPNPDSVIIAKYGQRDGFRSFYLNGSYAVGVRTRLAATYSERLTTSALTAGDLLSTTTLDPLGNPVDAQTGIPVLPGYVNSSLGVQSGLYKETLATASISQTWLRDTISLFVTMTNRDPVAQDPGVNAPQVSSEATSVGIRWGHDLAPTTSLVSFATVGISESGGGGNTNTYGLGVSLVQELRPGLAGALSYRFNMRDGGITQTGSQNAGDAMQNIFTLGLRQSF
ncbi:TIGR03016 family PEP-CTERM system-associated outer membrane protein [Elioraea rosea]|uniref:TIGR03016 family PEP-CTERM system-associated outer membrane protein n=1 Tax=Elioraea rosea TaxID=2492390 RepID=UPI0013151CF6|nr:TIGR03016 family PEP-CTERM system-associated outer membrane protein [Elioraea rosea]